MTETDPALMRHAESIYDYIETCARPFVRRGGRLWTKTREFSGESPASNLRRMLAPLDRHLRPTFVTVAEGVAKERLEREHALPLKRIAIEMIDPLQGDPRCNSNRVLIGPATCAEDVLKIFFGLSVVALVTRTEHKALAKAHPSSSWDALDGDWRKRYAKARVIVRPFA